MRGHMYCGFAEEEEVAGGGGASGNGRPNSSSISAKFEKVLKESKNIILVLKYL
jgi:hypothetical protein